MDRYLSFQWSLWNYHLHFLLLLDLCSGFLDHEQTALQLSIDFLESQSLKSFPRMFSILLFDQFHNIIEALGWRFDLASGLSTFIFSSYILLHFLARYLFLLAIHHLYSIWRNLVLGPSHKSSEQVASPTAFSWQAELAVAPPSGSSNSILPSVALSFRIPVDSLHRIVSWLLGHPLFSIDKI